VLETLLGLLDLTWKQLENEHNLREKFSLDPEEVLAEIRSQLGMAGGAR
jgi:hypothetical protein